VFEKDIQLFNNQCRIYIIIKLSTSQRWLFEEVVKPIPIPAILTKYDNLGETERGGICKIDLIFFLIWGKKRKITVQFTTRGFATL